MIDISFDKITIACDICGKVVYRADHISSIKGIQDFYPTTQEAYKVVCEKCYMTPVFEKETLEDTIRELKKKAGIREKRVKKMIDKYKYDDIYL